MAGREESMRSGMRAGGKEGRGQRGVIHRVDLGEVWAELGGALELNQTPLINSDLATFGMRHARDKRGGDGGGIHSPLNERWKQGYQDSHSWQFRTWKSFSAASHGIRTTAILHLHGNVIDKMSNIWPTCDVPPDAVFLPSFALPLFVRSRSPERRSTGEQCG